MLGEFAEKKTKVLLVQPRGVQEGFTRGETRLPPLGLLYIAAAIRPVADVRVIDADALNLDDDSVLRSLGNWSPDLVGMTVSWLTINTVRRFARRVKKETSGRVILGGPLPSAAPNEVLKYDEVDFVGIGDGEPIMSGLCEAIHESREPETVVGVLSKISAKTHSSDCSPLRANLEMVPQPAWDMLSDFSSYRTPDSLQEPVTIVEGQRGCPHSCSFCSVPAISGATRRSRLVASIIKEITYLTGNRGIKEISFVDPDFMTNKRYALDVSSGVASLGKAVSWFCNARASSVKESVAQKMQTAGCHLIYLGAESGDPDILARIHKHQHLEQVEQACKILRNSGIKPSVGFIIGFPFDTDESVKKTIQFAKRLQPAKFQFSIFNWFPGISMQVLPESVPVGFHPKNAITRWVDWQKRAYEEVGNDN